MNSLQNLSICLLAFSMTEQPPLFPLSPYRKMVRIRFNSVLRHKYTNIRVGCEGMQRGGEHERKGLQDRTREGGMGEVWDGDWRARTAWHPTPTPFVGRPPSVRSRAQYSPAPRRLVPLHPDERNDCRVYWVTIATRLETDTVAIWQNRKNILSGIKNNKNLCKRCVICKIVIYTVEYCVSRTTTKRTKSIRLRCTYNNCADCIAATHQ